MMRFQCKPMKGVIRIKIIEHNIMLFNLWN
jgi:hypothetical protein